MSRPRRLSVNERVRAGGAHPKSKLARDAADEIEMLDLQASAIACTVADAYQAARNADRVVIVPENLIAALDSLEELTRPSAMRKVRP